MIPLMPGEIYHLEDISKLSKFILIKMLELFGESAWGVIDIVSTIRRRLKDYSAFYHKYLKLSGEQRQILEFLAKKPAQASFVKEIIGMGEVSQRIIIEKEIKSLISTSWLIGGAHGNETLVLVTREVALLINAIPDYLAFLGAEKPSDGISGDIEFKLFDDLTQLTSHILKEPIKITNTGHLSKTALKKLMPKLSEMPSKEWEKLLNENYYPLSFNLLLNICEYMDCIEINAAPPNGQAQFLKPKEWALYLNMPPAKKLRIAIIVYDILLREFQRSECSLFLENILSYGNENKYQNRFLSPLKLLLSFNKDAGKNNTDELGRFGEYYDELFTYWVLEPLFYFGLVERTAVTMPTPWRFNNTEKAERYLWRLSPLGASLADILKKERKIPPQNTGRKAGELKDNWFEKTLKNDKLFLGDFDKFFPLQAAKELVIQNDMTFFAPRNSSPLLIWLLCVFGEVTQTEYIISGKFTKESIIKALKSGLEITELTALIKEESKIELPNAVLRIIEDWSSSYNRAIFAFVTVVVCDTPELAAELSANTKLSKAVLGSLGPQAVFIRREDEKTVRQWLEKKSRVPLPGIHNDEALAKWLQEYPK